MAQSIAHAAAAQEKPVVYFTSDVPRSGRRAHSPMAGTAIEVEAALVSRMDSLGLDTGPMQRDRTFKVAPIDYPTGIPSTMLGERAIDGITKAVEAAPVGRSLIVIDDITALAGIDKGLVLVRLLSYLDGLVDTGTSVVVASQPGALEGRSISNILSISNTFLHLAISDRSRMLIVQKSESDHLTTGMRLKFTVEKGSGLRVVA
jgi:archaellum biogenesis ATPase FlaH